MSVNNVQNTTFQALSNTEQSATTNKALNSQSSPKTSGLYDLDVHTPDKAKDITFFLHKSYAPKRTLRPSFDEQKNLQVETADGYKVHFKGENMEWSITAPSGETTRIWGDPHVDESDGDRWDFTQQSSFHFGDNKITVETTPWGNHGATVTKAVTVYNGNDRFTVSDIDKNEPTFTAWSLDGASHDKTMNDGDAYQLNISGKGTFSWDATETDK